VDSLFDPSEDAGAGTAGRVAAAVQRSLDDLGTPLHQVTFCVIDLETTGGRRNEDSITEIGAVKIRGGERLGTFQTLVNPGRAIPPEITVLTGITQSMVTRAPRIETVLPSLLEFIGDAVIVGHNVGFDTGFLDAALARSGRPRLGTRPVDTLALARRLLADEVPNCRLGTLASRLRLPNQPSHRALDDALATADLLHHLLERAGTLGVLGLDDLHQLPRIGQHPQAHKLKLTNDLPREPGVYLFLDRDRRVLYVGKATNLRTRVRSYFSGDRRRKVAQLLREAEHLEHIVCRGPLEAEVLEVRLIHRHQPRFNRHAKTWSKYAYLKLTLDERFPRLSVVGAPRDDGALYLGPLPSRRNARLVADAIESVVPLRRCTGRPAADPAKRTAGTCTAAQIGVARCPCAGEVTEEEYAGVVQRLVVALTDRHDLLLAPLRLRLAKLAAEERFEEAADTRDRAAALASALRRQHRVDTLRQAGRVVIRLPGRGHAELAGGVLVRSWLDDGAVPLWLDTRPAAPTAGPLPRDVADEVWCVAGWLDKQAGRVELVHCDGALASPYPPLDTFQPAVGVGGRRDG
jgi:DNA polymerase-3 subunit epsilon